MEENRWKRGYSWERESAKRFDELRQQGNDYYCRVRERHELEETLKRLESLATQHQAGGREMEEARLDEEISVSSERESLMETGQRPESVIETSVQLVNRMTCLGCNQNLPVVTPQGVAKHAWSGGRFVCDGKGRAIVDALIKMGWRPPNTH